MAAAAELERAWGAVAALEAAVSLPPEDGDVPARILVEHLADTRRRQKLLLTQLRVLRRLLGLIENPGPPHAPPPLRVAEARERWQGLKSGYGGALGALGGALPPALAQRGGGRRLLQRLRGVLGGRQKAELEVKVREAAGRRDQLRRRLDELRRERLSQQGAVRRLRGGAQRAGAGLRLYQMLLGFGVLPPPGPPRNSSDPPEVELESGAPPDPPDSRPPLRRSPGGGVRLLPPSGCPTPTEWPELLEGTHQ